jgi:hypothetical protein
MEQTERSETSAYKIQTPGNYPEENIQQDTHCLLPNCLTNTIVTASRLFFSKPAFDLKINTRVRTILSVETVTFGAIYGATLFGPAQMIDFYLDTRVSIGWRRVRLFNDTSQFV